MSLLIWNVRGLNKERRKKDAMEHIQKLFPSIVALVETKFKLNKMNIIVSCVPKPGSHVTISIYLPKAGYGSLGTLLFGLVQC